MSSFFHDSDGEDDDVVAPRRSAAHAAAAVPHWPPAPAVASSSRAASVNGSVGASTLLGSTLGTRVGSGSRDFLSRLESVSGSPPRTKLFSDPDDAASTAGAGAVPALAGSRTIFSPSSLDPGPEEAELDDVRRLGRVCVRERGLMVILPWEADLVDSLCDKLEQQGKMLATLRADPATSEEEHFKLVQVQTEMERAKYLIRLYVRTRLHKIEKFSQYIVDSPALHSLLSGAELQHARRYTELLHTHFQHSALESLPEWLRGMNDTLNDGQSMVTKPNLDTPILIYCRKDCGEITLERGEAAVLGQGTTHLVRYKLVERWINLGWAEVL